MILLITGLGKDFLIVMAPKACMKLEIEDMKTSQHSCHVAHYRKRQRTIDM